MSAAFSSENIITLFSMGGKTMIGSFITYPAAGNVGSGAAFKTGDKDSSGIFSKLMGNESSGAIDYEKYYFDGG